MWTLIALVGFIAGGDAEMYVYPTKFPTEAVCKDMIPKAKEEVLHYLDVNLEKGAVVALSISCMDLPVPGQDL